MFIQNEIPVEIRGISYVPTFSKFSYVPTFSGCRMCLQTLSVHGQFMSKYVILYLK